MADTAPDGTIFETHGSREAPPVFLIHGLGLNRACWQWTVPALENRFRVITYDLFGHGDSPPPPSTPSLSLFARQVGDLMDHLGVNTASFVGFSLGGMIARKIAQEMPERTTALAILHSPYKRTPDAQKAILKRVEQARNDGPASTVEAALERWFTDAYRTANPEMMDLVRSWVMANRLDVYHTIYKVLADGIDEIVAPDPAIACPALVMTGDEDYGNGPEMTRAIAAEMVDAEVVNLKGLRHMALAEDPDAVNTPVFRFLDRTTGATT